MVEFSDGFVVRVMLDIWEADMLPLSGRTAIESLLSATCKSDKDKSAGRVVGVGGMNS